MNKRSLLMLVLMAIAVCLASVGVGAAEEVHITLAGNYAKVEDACGVAVAGNYAYVVDKNNGLVIVDVSNPAAPIRVGSYDSEYATDVAVSGSYAYFAGYDGLVIFDMRNPASPVLAGIYDTLGVAHSVAVSGSYAYVVCGVYGLVIVDISNPAAPILAGSYDTTSSILASDVAVSGNYAYVAGWANDLVIFDISNPAAPVLVGSYDTVEDARGVAVSGNYAYVTDWANGLVIIDISNPALPVLAGSYDTGYAIGVAVSGNYAYVADWANGLVIVDISNPAAPILAGSYGTAGYAGYAEDVAISGNYAYVAISSNYAYVADDSGGLVVLHIAETGSISVSSSPSGANIYLDGSYKGTTPLTLNSVSAGTHTVKLTKSGYSDVSSTVTVNSGQTASVSKKIYEIPAVQEQPVMEEEYPTNSNTIYTIVGAIVVSIFGLFGIILKKSKKSNGSADDAITFTTPKPIEFKEPSTSTPASTIIAKENSPIKSTSAFGYKSATIIHKIKIENPTSDPIGDIKIHLFVPDVFLLENKEKSISMLEPNESKTVTFEIRPTGECGDCNVSGRVNYYMITTLKNVRRLTLKQNLLASSVRFLKLRI